MAEEGTVTFLFYGKKVVTLPQKTTGLWTARSSCCCVTKKRKHKGPVEFLRPQDQGVLRQGRQRLRPREVRLHAVQPVLSFHTQMLPPQSCLCLFPALHSGGPHPCTPTFWRILDIGLDTLQIQILSHLILTVPSAVGITTLILQMTEIEAERLLEIVWNHTVIRSRVWTQIRAVYL